MRINYDCYVFEFFEKKIHAFVALAFVALVSGRHVGTNLGEHQLGVSIQISINLGKTFLRISSIRKIAVT